MEESSLKTFVILPTYQERQNVDSFVRRVFAYAPDAHVLVVDDNSPDGTAHAARALSAEFPRLAVHVRARKEGLGRAYIDAFERVLQDPEVDVLVMMDADFSHDPVYLPVLLDKARTSDFVIASRYVEGGGLEGWEPWRRFLSSGGNRYARLITGIPVADLTGGFNVIRAAALRRLDLASLTSSGYAFQMELKYRLWKTGASFAEVPIVFRNRRGGESKISNHIILEGVIAPWKLRWR